MAMSEVDRFAEFYRMLGYELEDFQRLIVEECFSARRETLVLLPRANGKSTLLAGIAMWSLLRGTGQQIVVGAASREQASVLFDVARSMAQHPEIASEPEARALTRAELSRLLGHVPDDWRLLVELLAQTGLRISEAIGLTWADVEFGARPRLKLRQQDCRGEVGPLKSEYSRRDVPLSPRSAGQLWEIGADRPGSARVFTSPHGFPLSYGNLRRRVLLPATEAAGLQWVTFHSFRHTCASLLFEAGRDVKQVSAWLGHPDPAFTLRTSIHLMDEGVGDAAFMGDAVTISDEHETRVGGG